MSGLCNVVRDRLITPVIFAIYLARDLRLIKVPVASTSLSQRWLSEVEAI